MGMIKIPSNAIKHFEKHYPSIFESGSLAEGNWNKKLGSFFESYTNCNNAIPFCSNGSGLVAILMLLKKYRNKKDIFIQSNTMYGVKTIAVTSGLNLVGTVPCSLPSLMPSAVQVKDFINNLKNPSQTVFLITHIGGIVNPEITEIAKICKDNGVILVEDCAHSLGSTLNGKHTGLFGIAGVYSLYATKAINAGEGGIVVTNDEELGYQLSKFQIYDRFDQIQEVACNFRISELQALFSYSMCVLSEEIIQNKTVIAQKYIDACNEVGIQFINPIENGQRGNHYKFSLIAKSDANKEFKLITNRTSPVYDYKLGEDPFNVHKKHICLPIWYNLDKEIIDSTIKQVLSLSNK